MNASTDDALEKWNLEQKKEAKRKAEELLFLLNDGVDEPRLDGSKKAFDLFMTQDVEIKPLEELDIYMGLEVRFAFDQLGMLCRASFRDVEEVVEEAASEPKSLRKRAYFNPNPCSSPRITIMNPVVGE